MLLSNSSYVSTLPGRWTSLRLHQNGPPLLPALACQCSRMPTNSLAASAGRMGTAQTRGEEILSHQWVRAAVHRRLGHVQIRPSAPKKGWYPAHPPPPLEPAAATAETQEAMYAPAREPRTIPKRRAAIDLIGDFGRVPNRRDVLQLDVSSGSRPGVATPLEDHRPHDVPLACESPGLPCVFTSFESNDKNGVLAA